MQVCLSIQYNVNASVFSRKSGNGEMYILVTIAPIYIVTSQMNIDHHIPTSLLIVFPFTTFIRATIVSFRVSYENTDKCESE